MWESETLEMMKKKKKVVEKWTRRALGVLVHQLWWWFWFWCLHFHFHFHSLSLFPLSFSFFKSCYSPLTLFIATITLFAYIWVFSFHSFSFFFFSFLLWLSACLCISFCFFFIICFCLQDFHVWLLSRDCIYIFLVKTNFSDWWWKLFDTLYHQQYIKHFHVWIYSKGCIYFNFFICNTWLFLSLFWSNNTQWVHMKVHLGNLMSKYRHLELTTFKIQKP